MLPRDWNPVAAATAVPDRVHVCASSQRTRMHRSPPWDRAALLPIAPIRKLRQEARDVPGHRHSGSPRPGPSLLEPLHAQRSEGPCAQAPPTATPTGTWDTDSSPGINPAWTLAGTTGPSFGPGARSPPTALGPAKAKPEPRCCPSKSPTLPSLFCELSQTCLLPERWTPRQAAALGSSSGSTTSQLCVPVSSRAEQGQEQDAPPGLPEGS